MDKIKIKDVNILMLILFLLTQIVEISLFHFFTVTIIF